MLTLVLPAPSLAWNEPDNFRGLKFGEDVTKAIPECSYTVSRLGPEEFRIPVPSDLKKGPCWMENMPDKNKYIYPNLVAGGIDKGTYTLFGLGPIGDVSVKTYARQLEDKLALIGLSFPSASAGKLLATLKERYGDPTIEKVEDWQSKAGAKFTNLTASWIGKRVSIVFNERGSTIDRGTISYMTDFWLAHQEQRREDVIKKGAKDL